MGTIEVVVGGNGGAGKVDELTGRVPELVEEWNEQLAECERAGRALLELPSMELSEKNSSNFQVIGMLYRVVSGFQREHELPSTVRILCDSESTARMYRQIYNFYVPGTKAERMTGEGWD